MTTVLVVLPIGTLLVIVWLLVYKVTHPHTRDDLSNVRLDSLSKSRHTTSGKVSEQLAPLFPEFLDQFKPLDARFLGSPIDFIVFDGLCEDETNDVRGVVFVEVKTGRSGLQKRERRVRDAIQAGRVSYQLLRLPGASVDVAQP